MVRKRQFFSKNRIYRGQTGRALLSVSVALACSISLAKAQTPQPSKSTPLKSASIEQLLNMSITSVSKTPERLNNVAAAVAVITSEDIRRSGATSIPEALRLAPGVQVAQVDANKWAVSIRGFNARAANKLLVMIDGRTIYDPLFSGTLWETKDVMLEDVDRIEVWRGPGGITWGANAVNGVISIITKKSEETQGGLVTAGAGNEDRGFSSVRYGSRINDENFFRVWGQYHNRDEGYPAGVSKDDSWIGSGGFRFDGELSDIDSYSIIGGASTNESDGVASFGDLTGKNQSLSGKWQRRFDERSQFELNAFYDHTYIDASIYDEWRHTAEVDFIHNMGIAEHSRFTYGATYRFTSDRSRSVDGIQLDPRKRRVRSPSLFAKTNLSLIPDTLEATLGAKVEHNSHSGTEWQPEGSLLWHIHENHALWSRISRAVRVSSRIESDLVFHPPGGPELFRGNQDLDSEKLIAYELGYRVSPSRELSFDVATFYNDYDELITYEGATQGNKGSGQTYGVEFVAAWEATDWWRLFASYTHLRMDLDLDRDSIADPRAAIDAIEGNTPRNQAMLRNSFDFARGWQFDFALRYVDALSTPHVSSYLTADARIAWKVTEALELALVGQNLFDRHHAEHAPPDMSEAERAFYGKVTWTF